MNLDFDQLKKNEEEIIDFGSIEKSCYIDLEVEMPAPDILISIGEHEYKGNFYPTSVMSSGEFSAIIAQSKAKKSFLKSAFISSYIGGNSNIYFPNIKSHRKEDFTVLDFDTEQGNFYTQRTFRRVKDMSGFNYPNYYGYAMRSLSSNARLMLIDYCLKNQAEIYNKPVKLVSIDGIADLADNTNDIVMSKEVADYLLKWTDEYKIHIIVVIHKGGVTNKPLGHLGTFVLKKAESVINLDIDQEGVVKVSNPYSRGYRFEEFEFDINKDGIPYLIQ